MEEKKHPIGGFAPGNYQCHCGTCGGGFIGDKRSYQCESCAIRNREKFDALSPSEQTELMQRNAEFIKEALNHWVEPKANYAIIGHGSPDPEALTAADYEEVLKDHDRLVRELDVIMNGENAARQASLCDIVSLMETEWPKRRQVPIWVNASKKVSDKHSSELHWRFSHNKRPIASPFYINCGQLVQEYSNTKSVYALHMVEWLDEGGSSREMDKEVAFAEWAGWEWRRIEGKNLWENQKTLEILKSNDLYERFEKETGGQG